MYQRIGSNGSLKASKVGAAQISASSSATPSRIPVRLHAIMRRLLLLALLAACGGGSSQEAEISNQAI
ncbi:MAG: hypothetical protein ACYTF8_07630, partial [Planctomycetota bacterium]